MREEPLVKTIGLSVAGLICIIISVIAGGSVLWAVFALAVLVISLASYYVPTSYHINDTGVSIERPWATRHIGWSRIGSIKHNRHGVWLLPGAAVSATDSFRQVYIPVKGKDKAAKYAELCEESMHKQREGAGQ